MKSRKGIVIQEFRDWQIERCGFCGRKSYHVVLAADRLGRSPMIVCALCHH